MSRLLRITGLLLLAVWLPAILHCQIEAAGLDLHWLGAHDHDHSEHDSGGADHPFHHLDQQDFKPASLKDGVSVPPPAEISGVLVPIVRPSLDFPAPACRCAPPDLNRTWRFLARAVAPSQAP